MNLIQGINVPHVTLTPLGGMGEIGLNCQLWETPQGVVMIDCGLMFPSDEHLGIDVLIPNFNAVIAVRDKLQAIVLTHGHEDHIGALPWLIPHLKGIVVYGSRFTLALVQHKLEEHNITDFCTLQPVNAGSSLHICGLTLHFFPVCHSIPEGFAVGIESPVGRILHSGDFKIETSALSNCSETFAQFADFAGSGLRLLLSDSTNVTREGHSLSEAEVFASLGRIFAKATGRIIITLFSSHIQRIQEVFDLAEQYGRTVVISGKSLANNIEIAQRLGLIRMPCCFYNAYLEVPNLPDDLLVFLVTGAQGEPLSALSRMTYGTHKQLIIHEGDLVIMSSRIIPGNTRAIIRMINEMYKLGAEVLYESVHAIHASGHAHKEELRTLIETVQPEYFIPMHGEYRHLVKHSQLAKECGVAEGKNLLLEDGVPFTLFADGYVLHDKIDCSCTLVDGKGVGDVQSAVLRERKVLGDEGMVIVVVVFDEQTGELLYGPEMLSKGFVLKERSDVLDDAKCLVLDVLETHHAKAMLQIEDEVRFALRRFFRRVMERDPMIVPVFSEV